MAPDDDTADTQGWIEPPYQDDLHPRDTWANADFISYFYRDESTPLRECSVARHDGVFVFLSRLSSQVGAVHPEWTMETAGTIIGRTELAPWAEGGMPEDPLRKEERSYFQDVLQRAKGDDFQTTDLDRLVRCRIIVSME